MTNAEERDWLLKHLAKAGITDMADTPQNSQLYSFFIRHQSTLLYRNLIEKETSPPNTPYLYYVNVSITIAGRDFLANGGFTAE